MLSEKNHHFAHTLWLMNMNHFDATPKDASWLINSILSMNLRIIFSAIADASITNARISYFVTNCVNIMDDATAFTFCLIFTLFYMLLLIMLLIQSL